MTSKHIRTRLEKLIVELLDDMLEEVVSFTQFVMARQEILFESEDWENKRWQDFALKQIFREDDEVEYSLDDAKEIYRP